MSKTFHEDFYGFVFDRAQICAGDMAEKDIRFNTLSKEEDLLTEKIKNILGHNYKLLLEYESVFNSLTRLYTEYAYRQGLKDGVQLRQELGLTN